VFRAAGGAENASGRASWLEAPLLVNVLSVRLESLYFLSVKDTYRKVSRWGRPAPVRRRIKARPGRFGRHMARPSSRERVAPTVAAGPLPNNSRCLHPTRWTPSAAELPGARIAYSNLSTVMIIEAAAPAAAALTVYVRFAVPLL